MRGFDGQGEEWKILTERLSPVEKGVAHTYNGWWLEDVMLGVNVRIADQAKIPAGSPSSRCSLK